MNVNAKNRNLHRAKDSKKDEFYTQLSDIERELKHYKMKWTPQMRQSGKMYTCCLRKGFHEPQKVLQPVQSQDRPGGDQGPADDKRARPGVRRPSQPDQSLEEAAA